MRHVINFLRRFWGKSEPYLMMEAHCEGNLPTARQRAVFCGRGRFVFGKDIQIGWVQSPTFKSSYAYFEARFPLSVIKIGDECVFSNDAAVIAESEGGTSIQIGKRCVFGAGFRCYDSDFHGLMAEYRHDRAAVKTASVVIGDDCFFGERCMLLKGVRLGARCVVGAGSIVAKSFPADSVIAGNPARLIRKLA